jgi:hypothetical protein
MKSKTRRFANIVLFTLTAAWHFGVVAAPAANRDRSFDSGWRFLRADAPGAGDAGKITLKAEADGLKGATVVVKTH